MVWRSSRVEFLSVPLPPSLCFLGLGSPPPSRLFFCFVSGVCSFYFYWASGLSVTGTIVGGWARRGGRALVAGLRPGRPVGVLPPWGVIAVAAAWPMGTQTPLVTQALTMIIYTDDGL